MCVSGGVGAAPCSLSYMLRRRWYYLVQKRVSPDVIWIIFSLRTLFFWVVNTSMAKVAIWRYELS